MNMNEQFIDCYFCDRGDICMLEEDGIVSHLMRGELATLVVYLRFHQPLISTRFINCVI